MSDVQPVEAQLVDLQCRYMDLELLVAELNDVVAELGDQLMRAEQQRRSMAARLDRLEASDHDN